MSKHIQTLLKFMKRNFYVSYKDYLARLYKTIFVRNFIKGTNSWYIKNILEIKQRQFIHKTNKTLKLVDAHTIKGHHNRVFKKGVQWPSKILFSWKLFTSQNWLTCLLFFVEFKNHINEIPEFKLEYHFKNIYMNWLHLGSRFFFELCSCLNLGLTLTLSYYKNDTISFFNTNIFEHARQCWNSLIQFSMQWRHTKILTMF